MFTGICGSLCIFQLIRCWLLKLSRLKWFGALLSSGCRAHCASVIPLSVLRDPRESQHISVGQLVIWDTWFSSQDRLLGAPAHENLLSLGCKQSVSVQGEKKKLSVVLGTISFWCLLEFVHVQTFHRWCRVCWWYWAHPGWAVRILPQLQRQECSNPALCPSQEAAPLDGKNVSALEVHEKWFLSWKLVCWVCYWVFHIRVVPSSSGSWGWDLMCCL